MKRKFYNDLLKWQADTFGKPMTATPTINHLIEEVQELKEAVAAGNHPSICEELADCFILLYGAAGAEGFTHKDIADVIKAKMEINKKRKWGHTEADGVVHHIKEDEQKQNEEIDILLTRHPRHSIHQEMEVKIPEDFGGYIPRLSESIKKMEEYNLADVKLTQEVHKIWDEIFADIADKEASTGIFIRKRFDPLRAFSFCKMFTTPFQRWQESLPAPEFPNAVHIHIGAHLDMLEMKIINEE